MAASARVPTPKRKESAIQAAVLGCLRAHGVLCWPTNREKGNWRRASHVGFKGLPDISGVLKGGRAIFVEVKRPGEVPNVWQKGAHALLQSQGALVFTVTCVEEIKPKLDAWIRGDI
jgi:hypothetical protein